MAAAAVEATRIDDSTGLSDRGCWLGAPADASSGNVAVAVASSGASAGSGSGSESESGSGSSVDMLLLAVGVLGLLLFPALFWRMRSTSDGRAFKVGRKPSIQAEFKSKHDWLSRCTRAMQTQQSSYWYRCTY